MAAKQASEGMSNAFHVTQEGTKLGLLGFGKVKILARQYFEEDFEDELASVEYDTLLTEVGANELTIAVHAIHVQNFNVPAGSAVVWNARLKKSEITFYIRDITSKNNVIELVPPATYKPDWAIKGKIPASDKQRTLAFYFDNSKSHNERKTVAYRVQIGPNVTLLDEAVEMAKTKERAAAEEGPEDD